MTTIDNKGLNAVLPATAGAPLRIRVLLMTGKTSGKGVWLTITRDEELSIDTPENDRNVWLLERPGGAASKAAKCLDLWSRKINVHLHRIAASYERGDSESIKRLLSTIKYF